MTHYLGHQTYQQLPPRQDLVRNLGVLLHLTMPPPSPALKCVNLSMPTGFLRDMNIQSGNTSALFAYQLPTGPSPIVPTLTTAKRPRLRRKTFSLPPSLQLVCVSDSRDDELDFPLDTVQITPLTPQLRSILYLTPGVLHSALGSGSVMLRLFSLSS